MAKRFDGHYDAMAMHDEAIYGPLDDITKELILHVEKLINRAYWDGYEDGFNKAVEIDSTVS